MKSHLIVTLVLLIIIMSNGYSQTTPESCDCTLDTIGLEIYINSLNINEDVSLKFKVANSASKFAVLYGGINSNTPNKVQNFINNYPNVTTLVFMSMPGSDDDEANLEASQLLRDRGYITYLPGVNAYDEDSFIASGAVDMFLAGTKRIIDVTGEVGVHAWSDDNNSATDYPVGHPFHLEFIDYYVSMGFSQADAEAFYYFTINAAPPNDIHNMTESEIEQYKLRTCTYDNTLNYEVTIDNSTMTVSLPNFNYQWLDCDNNYAEIPGATGQSYTATSSGDYAVQVFNDNCSETSECYFIGSIDWFVNQQNGSNSNDGKSATAAFKSIDSATNIAKAGDNIIIMGSYTNTSYNSNYQYTNEHEPHLWHKENTININNLHGNASNYITIKAFDSNTILKGDGANIFRVKNSSYLKIEGFDIQGEVSNIPIETANSLQFVYIDEANVLNPTDPTATEIEYRDQDCISNCTEGEVVDGEIYTNLSNQDIKRPSYIDTRGMYLTKVQYIDIINNTIHDMPGGGLRVSDSEDILIEGNEIYACSKKSYSGTHALVVTKATSTRNTNDYRIQILRNKIHHNYNEQYSWSPTKTIVNPQIDEGKGISLQRNQTTYKADGTIKINWEHGRILVENNICYFNGYSGIHSNDGNRIDINNNTVYFNSYTKSISQESTSNNGGNIGISAQGGSDIKITNNISIIDSGLNKSAISSNLTAAEGLVVRDNMIYGTTLSGDTGTIDENANVAAVQVNTQKAEPLFSDAVNFDFSLQSNSGAIGNADANTASSIDYLENDRDTDPDLGAIEFQSILPIEFLSFDVSLDNNNHVDINWATASEINNDYFIIEKSADGKEWKVLEKIDGAGNSLSTIEYYIKDIKPNEGDNYYRIVQIDYDGHSNTSDIRIITIPQSKFEISIYPNPSINDLFIKSDLEINEVKIYNALGTDCTSLIKVDSMNSKLLQIETNQLDAGTYFIITKNIDNNSSSENISYGQILRL